MTKQISFSKLEKEVRPKLREKMNSAESTEDIKKFFAQTVHELLVRILGENAELEYEDIYFNPHEKDGYTVSERLRKVNGFASAWKDSDLLHIVKRMAEFAMKRYKHLERHPDKTEAKIYPIPGRGGHQAE